MKLIWAKRDVRVFLAGVLCGTIFMAVVGAVSVWWKPRPAQLLSTHVGIEPWQLYAAPKRRPTANKNDALYDMCLAAGNTVVACNAFMRLLNPQPPRPYSLSLRAEISVRRRGALSWLSYAARLHV
jgi:hypothetical protein